MNDVDILFDQKKTLVVNKPGGVLTQAPPGIDSMELRIKRALRDYQLKHSSSDETVDIDRKVYVGVPHRLDRPVSGIMVLGKNKPTTRLLASQFRERTIKKIYWAVVQGTPEESEALWEDSMRKMPDTAKSELVDVNHPDAQVARLRHKVLGTDGDASWLRIELETGRTHQIRLQTSSRGLPILGDALYGSPDEFGPITEDLRARWIALHARRLEFTLPSTDKRIELSAPLSNHWNPLIERFPEMNELPY